MYFIGMSKAAVKDDVAKRLREARSAVYKTAAEAARAVGMNPVTVRAHENGQNAVDYYHLEKYARRYGVDIGWLMTGETANAPRGLHHVEFGEIVDVVGQLQDGAWLPVDPESDDWPMVVAGSTPTGRPEVAIFTDPRFPAQKVSAFRVVSRRSEGEYPNNSIVFAYPAWEIGHRDGDHVVIVRSRGDFCEWTLRKVVTEGLTKRYVALTSDEPPFEWSMDPEGDRIWVVGTVVGSLVRRDVNTPTIEDLAHDAEVVRKMTARERAERRKK